jgi:hypothetical protein
MLASSRPPNGTFRASSGSAATNEASALRLIGAVLAEHHEVWSTGKRYFDMTEYFEWKTTQTQELPQEIRKVS